MNKKRVRVEAGTTFGPLTAIKRVEDYVTPSSGQVSERWLWRCRCGTSVVLRPSDARYRASLDIGCRSMRCDAALPAPKPESKAAKPWWWWKWMHTRKVPK